jgi:hypothetical protein
MRAGACESVGSSFRCSRSATAGTWSRQSPNARVGLGPMAYTPERLPSLGSAGIGWPASGGAADRLQPTSMESARLSRWPETA